MKRTLLFFGLRTFFVFLVGCHLAKGQCPAEITASSTNLCAQLPVSFQATASSAIVSYEWNFNNQGSATGRVATFSFEPTNNTYQATVTLTIRDTAGATCSANQLITVQATPNITGALNPAQLCLSASSTRDTFTTSLTVNLPLPGPYTWNWGDGSGDFTSNNTVNTHTYSQYGSFPVSVSIQDGACTGYFRDTVRFYKRPSVDVRFELGNTDLCEGQLVELINDTDGSVVDYYVWNWGDGTVESTTENDPPPHSYTLSSGGNCSSDQTTFNIEVEAYNSCESRFFHAGSVLAFVSPTVIAEIGLTDSVVCVDQPVNFRNLTCPQDNALQFEWDFGDGSSATGFAPAHTFTEPGVYTVTLRATNPADVTECGAIDDTQTVIVTDVPQVAVTYTGNGEPNSSGGCGPFTFIAENTTTPEAGVNFEWTVEGPTGYTFLNGTDRRSRNPEIQFNQAGTYTLRLTASNQCGNGTPWEQTLEISASPSITLTPTPDTCGEFSTSFLATVDPGSGTIGAITWTFPGGTPDTFVGETPPEISFPPRETPYVVLVTTENECGTNSATDTFIVSGLSTIDIPGDTAICSNGNALPLEASPDGGSWLGEFVDATSSEFLPPVGTSGDFSITYQVGSGACQVEATVNITVNPGPPIEINATDTTACLGVDTLTVSATPTGGTWENGDLTLSEIIPDAVGQVEKTYTYTDPLTGCNASASKLITISDLPTVEVQDRTYCRTDQNIELTNFSPQTSPQGTGLWAGPGIVDGSGIFNSLGVEDSSLVLTYTFTTSAGCVDSADMILSLVVAEVAEAGPNDTLCFNDPVLELAGNSPQGGVWEGPGIIPGTSQFNPILANLGENLLRYTIGTAECETQDTRIILVRDTAGVNTGEVLQFCEGSGIITLQATPGGGAWSGLGIVDPLLGSLDTDLLPSEEEVSLIYEVSTAEGCASRAEQVVSKTGLPAVDFAFSDTVCVNQSLGFSNNSLDDALYSWDFGDGNTSMEANPSHAYLAAGSFSIQLVVRSNSTGCTDSLQRPVFVVDVPSASFTQDVSEGCAQVINDTLIGLSVLFENTSQSNGGVSIWAFGTGDSSSNPNPGQIIFPQSTSDTTYQIQLSIDNGCGVSEASSELTVFPLPQVRIGLKRDDGCSPFVLDADSLFNLTEGNPESYFWNLGNGSVSQEELPPSQVYTTEDRDSLYILTLIAENVCGSDTGTQSLVIHPNTITANFSLDTTRACGPLTINPEDFSNAPFTIWDFGDGTLGDSSRTPTHTYTESGTYTVQLIAHNQCSFDTTLQEVQVLPNVSSEALFKSPICVGEEISFTPTTQEGIAAFQWNFSDGTELNGNSPTHIFTESGNLTLQLTTLSDTFLCPSVWNATLRVNPLPVVEIGADSLAGCAPLEVNFFNNSEGPFFSWDFGNGGSSNDRAPMLSFPDSGSYQVRFQTEDEQGCRSDSTLLVQVYPSPVADFILPKTLLCEGEEFQPENLSMGFGNSYDWDMGDGERFLVGSPTYSYEEAGNYSITLLASNIYQCFSQTSRDLRVVTQPKADFSIQGEPCTNQLTSFLPFELRGDQWAWDLGDGGATTDSMPEYFFALPGEYSISVEVSEEGVCFDDAQMNWTVFESPVAAFGFVYDTLPNGVVFFQGETSSPTYEWWVDGQLVSNSQNFQYDFGRFDTFSVALITTLANGCSDTLTQLITPPYGGLHIPTGFYPDGGTPVGDAQFFKPVGIGLDTFHIAVYNQWGNVVWESTALDAAGSPLEFWDGTSLQNKLSRNNAYVWKILVAQFRDGRPYKGKTEGNLTLVR
ncbi:MAG: PKD domain-containing protein [Bacteroidota bacterium]